ncbi:hypothetical protein KI811_16690 [Geobacter hydrogenophilus]|uniref:Tle cognate immunity protein 4 C-terminal domain-containing protein n=1 Tax=Geobacter hydrogenophilus TaxID=40983 RepID=A0A9W6G0S4_9BACT|nr:T6SS immunity protein Tli4 family protein [Geobacter hydrogenophilus]MBT0895444.1 hypothetical protein [Geobacter hydrogenophilus]GLI38332.1 hypothetical protein GHYDROH2_18330 [Geobacter hydrogenophilus]
MNVRILLSLLMVLVMAGCGNAAGNKIDKSKDLKKGATSGMKTYHMGRFAIDVPAEFKLEVQQQKIRYAEVSDFLWKNSNHRGKDREDLWQQKIKLINKKPKPVNNNKTIIEERMLQGLGKWAKAVVYHGNYLVPELIYWTLLVDYGDVAVWLTLDGTNNEMTINNFTNILSSYHYGSSQNNKGNYSLRYGVISLPYLEQESTYARFEGHPLIKKLEITMNETHEEESKKDGLLGRLAASLMTGFASGVDIDKVRTGKRTIAGMKGEETILRMDDGMKKRLNFIWRYAGDKDSGNRPKIVFDMESELGQEKEKIKLWDAMLDSMRAQ